MIFTTWTTHGCIYRGHIGARYSSETHIGILACCLDTRRASWRSMSQRGQYNFWACQAGPRSWQARMHPKAIECMGSGMHWDGVQTIDRLRQVHLSTFIYIQLLRCICSVSAFVMRLPPCLSYLRRHPASTPTHPDIAGTCRGHRGYPWPTHDAVPPANRHRSSD
jgi:hypothetical protein